MENAANAPTYNHLRNKNEITSNLYDLLLRHLTKNTEQKRKHRII